MFAASFDNWDGMFLNLLGSFIVTRTTGPTYESTRMSPSENAALVKY
jgi:hypothetical protein